LQHQIRVAPDHVDRIELDAADVPDELQDAVFAAQAARWQQALVRQQKAPGQRSAQGERGLWERYQGLRTCIAMAAQASAGRR
jgi:hypothetical protein